MLADSFSQNVVIAFFLGKFLKESTVLVNSKDKMFLAKLFVMLLGFDIFNLIDTSLTLPKKIVFTIFLIIKVLEKLNSRQFWLKKDTDSKAWQRLIFSDTMKYRDSQLSIFNEIYFEFFFWLFFDLTVGANIMFTKFAFDMLPKIVVMEISHVTFTADERFAKKNHFLTSLQFFA